MQSAKKTILIIEDEKPLQQVLRDRLREEGFDVHEALDGEEGMRKIAEIQPDLLILDIILPRTDGFSVLQQIRVNAPPSFPVCVLTNLADEPSLERVRSFLLPSDRYLVKTDTSMNTVMSVIHTVLNAYHDVI